MTKKPKKIIVSKTIAFPVTSQSIIRQIRFTQEDTNNFCQLLLAINQTNGKNYIERQNRSCFTCSRQYIFLLTVMTFC